MPKTPIIRAILARINAQMMLQSVGYLLDVLQNKEPRLHQGIFIINIEGYAYRVPFVEDEEKIFLKTAYLSSKDTKKYLSNPE